MELGFIVGKRLSIQVVFVSHFYWFYIPSVKKNVLQDGIAVSEGISRIACELQIVAGKILSLLLCTSSAVCGASGQLLSSCCL